MFEGARIRAMEHADLERVLAWRNHPDVRRHMLMSAEIALETHRRWFEAASRDPGRRLLIAETDQQPLGFVQFHGVEPGGIADWGFYAVPGAARGAGGVLGRLALDLAFESLALHKVCGQALAGNEASIGFHLKLGFRQEGVLRDQHRAGDTYVDMVCFGLLRDEWRARRAMQGKVADGQD